MKKKQFQITADMFNNKYLTALMDFMSVVSPARTKDEKKIRENDRKIIASGDLGEAVERKTANRNGSLDRDRILSGVSVFGNVPELTENDIKLISDAGFDFVINGNQGEYGHRVSDWCGKYGLAVIGEDLREFIAEGLGSADYEDPRLFDGFAPRGASVGDMGIDEPNAAAFPFVAKLHRAYKSSLPERFIFSNLLPGGAIKSALGTSSYREYVERYSSEVGGDYLSVDIYPFHPSSVINKAEMALCLKTYHAVGDVCRREGKDFWLYVQTQMRWFSHLYTTTTCEMIKWQVYASLCYGCRSIIHASYNPVWGDDAIGIVDYGGNLTEQYLYVKRINSEIQKLSPVLKDYRSLGVVFADEKKKNPHFVLARAQQAKDNRIQGFSGISAVKGIESEGTALVGFFENSVGGNALMIVNCKNIYDPYAFQSVTVRFDGVYTVSVYEHGELKRQAVTDEMIVSAGSCDGVFVTFEKT